VIAAVAVVAIAVVAGLGLRSASDPAPAIPRDATPVTVTDTPVSRPVAPGFVGLSIEYTTVEPYAGTDPSAINPVFVRLLRSLAPGGQPVLRIGGDSTDWAWWPLRGHQPPAGVRFTLHERFVRVTRALAQDSRARLILGLNLEAGSRQLMAAEAAALSGVGRSALSAFELGNEPELYGAFSWYMKRGRKFYGRPHGYGFSAYDREFTSFAKVLPRDVPLAGPETGGPRFIAQTPNFVRSQPRVGVVTLHLYPLRRCFVSPRAPAYPSIAHLLAAGSSAGLAATIAPYVPIAHAHGATLRIAEMNSVSCGGASGVSDRFASALWVLDALFHLAQEGVDGVNFHTSTQAIYRPFSFEHVGGRWTATVKPEYYGLYTFAHVAPAGSKLLKVSAPSDESLRVWATRARDGREQVLLINTSAGSSRTVALRLRAAPGRRASVAILTAPSLGSPHGIRLGGQFFARNTTTGALTGDRVVAHPKELRSGVYVVRVPAGSAAILTR
jgi:hypothetical protein